MSDVVVLGKPVEEKHRFKCVVIGSLDVFHRDFQFVFGLLGALKGRGIEGAVVLSTFVEYQAHSKLSRSLSGH
jgi:predicted Zn-dependent protease